MRGVAAQPLPLVQRLVDEAHVTLLEVAQATVDELGALAGRAAGEVLGLDQRGAQPARRRVEGDAGARDAAADDEDVELLGAEAIEHRRPIERRLGHRGGGRQPRHECTSGWFVPIASGIGPTVVLTCVQHDELDGGSIRVASGCRLAEARRLSRPRRQHLLPGRRRRCGGGQIGLRGLRGAGGVPRARPDVTGEGRRLGWRHRRERRRIIRQRRRSA